MATRTGKEMLASHAKEYVNVLCSVILENALKQEYDYKTFQWAELMSWLKSESSATPTRSLRPRIR